MANFNVPTTDDGVDNLLQQFKTSMVEYGFEIGFDASDLDEIIAAANDFNAQLLAANLAKAAARAAVANKDEQKDTSVAIMRKYAQMIKVNPLATNAIQEAFGIQVNPSSSGSVVVPNSLSAEAFANGTCRLDWKPNGNASGTTYIVEVQTSGGAWTYLTTVTATKYVDTAASPGIQRSYRVRAKRGSTTSPASDAATIYLNEEGLQLLEAA